MAVLCASNRGIQRFMGLVTEFMRLWWAVGSLHRLRWPDGKPLVSAPPWRVYSCACLLRAQAEWGQGNQSDGAQRWSGEKSLALACQNQERQGPDRDPGKAEMSLRALRDAFPPASLHVLTRRIPRTSLCLSPKRLGFEHMGPGFVFYPLPWLSSCVTLGNAFSLSDLLCPILA